MKVTRKHSAAAPDSAPLKASPEAQAAAPDAPVAAASPLVVAPDLPQRLQRALPSTYEVARGQDGNAYIVSTGPINRHAYRVGSRQCNAIVRGQLRRSGASATPAEVREINEGLTAHAEMYGRRVDVWYRVAQIDRWIEIALYDDADTRVRITPGRVEVVAEGSATIFCRTPHCKPMAAPAASGNVRLLKRYVNLDEVQFTLFVAWVTYTLAHPKLPKTKYVILLLIGSQGSGKSYVAQVALWLIDPSTIGVQRFPGSVRDLAIAANNAHVLAFDNLRRILPSMSDALCTVATGGAYATRQLYTDADQAVLPLQAALVLNSIHAGFVDQPDLAQRCLPLHLRPIDERQRKSEVELARQFEADLPAIQRGLFDRIAAILQHLDAARVTMPERMIDFSRWLRAAEMADGIPGDPYQTAYSEALNEGQRDGLLDTLLGATVLQFAEKLTREWHGTPTELHEQLNGMITRDAQRSREWSSNPIAMSLRLRALAPALLTQGIRVEFARGKERTITINNTEAGK